MPKHGSSLNIPDSWRCVRPTGKMKCGDVFSQILDLSKLGWIYRGESRIFPNRRASIGRGWNDKPEYDILLGNECSLIENFRHHAHSEIGFTESTFFDGVASMLVLMQHHGVPTRLLDWSHSIWVAIYHAISSIGDLDEPAVIWCFDTYSVFKNLPETWKEAGAAAIGARTTPQYRLALEQADQFLLPFGIVEATSRMRSQQGTYTIAHHADVDHASLIGSIAPPNTAFVLVIQSKDMKRFLMQKLLEMNVHAASLYPSIDGVGRFLSECWHWGLSVPGRTSHIQKLPRSPANEDL